MASARLLSRRVCNRIGLSLFSNLGQSSTSVSSPSGDGAMVLSRSMSSFPLANVGLDRRNEAGRFRVYSSAVSEGGSEEQKEDISQSISKAQIKPAPRPFKLNNVQRALAGEIGYRVVDRYTEEDFGQNKRPKAFAVVQIGSHQFKVSPNDLIYTEKLKYCDINDKLMLSKVLLLGSKDQTIIGRPTVPRAAVYAVVEEHALDEKVIIFKKKRRKNYRRTTGHRQELTRLRILEVKGICVGTASPTPLRKVKASSSSKVKEKSPRAGSNTEIVPPVLA